MIIDVTGVELTPGNLGKDCLGNGEHYDRSGELIECCCDECDYMLCCLEDNFKNGYFKQNCAMCEDINCPRNKAKRTT